MLLFFFSTVWGNYTCLDACVVGFKVLVVVWPLSWHSSCYSFATTWVTRFLEMDCYYWRCMYLIDVIPFFRSIWFYIVTWITIGLYWRHLIYTLKLINCLFWCMGIGEAKPSIQDLCWIDFSRAYHMFYLFLTTLLWNESLSK